ncbi:MAG: hypothetical protein OEQ53_04600 [Saprospiraceae bacterium]|nr:hypothetical protein [Saprospiraceae bacterium]
MPVPKYLVAIFGGAVSGSEAASQLAARGIPSVVFEQNALPYGKIEDGLPKWHVKLRDKEINKINEKLSHPLVTFVPCTGLGKELDFVDISKWGFSAILLAIGAWRDRPLPVDGIEVYEGKGLVYQNPFIYWFNHKHEPSFDDSEYEIKDEVAIIGGGLASLDVAKVLMFETVRKALRERGHDVDLFTLDRSIAKVLGGLELTLEDLGVKGCTLFYRRRAKDMPLSPLPTATPEQLEKAQNVREKILNNYQSKYLFNFEPNHVPVRMLIEDDKLVGLVFRRTKIENGRAIAIEGSDREVRFPYVVSSIGSIPEEIEGIPSQGQTYQIEDEVFCRVQGFPRVYALGNAVTGRGNIKESAAHGKLISENVIEGFLHEYEGQKDEQVAARIQEAIGNITEEIEDHRLSPASYETIVEKVKILQQNAAYQGDYHKWVDAHMPQRLEKLLGIDH